MPANFWGILMLSAAQFYWKSSDVLLPDFWVKESLKAYVSQKNISIISFCNHAEQELYWGKKETFQFLQDNK